MPSITFFQKEIFIVFPISPQIYVYDLHGYLIRTADMSAELPKDEPLGTGEDARMHAAEYHGYLNVQPVAYGKYFIQGVRDMLVLPPKIKRNKSAAGTSFHPGTNVE